ncbi:protein-L-isoaspartate O-methyltransferase family protein [Simplicispira psychrophila]|uniref:protein-L-isoaspartate O-methyltransferase family protein n=1 Tax=Simplicispira psychrophila TaxID=80882 RepID=UPI000486105C|nr:protein-L-isoaspartate O-methyltransferase [Simplicispira psychrophila]
MNMPLNTPFALASDPIEQARYNMIEQQIRTWLVHDADVLDTLAQVRREQFVPPACSAMAFMDLEIPLHGAPEDIARTGQCMLNPKVEARMLQDLKVQKNERVLEIGAGSGYMAALLAYRAHHVVTLEINPELAEMARENLDSAGVTNVTVRLADGAQPGTVPDGPFDVIVLSGSVATVPQELLAQLRDGGRLAAFTGQDPVMRATFVQRTGDRFVTTEPWDMNSPRLLNFPEPQPFKF